MSEPHATEAASPPPTGQAPGTASGAPWLRWVARPGVPSLLVGSALVVAAFFAPWFDLAKPASDLPHDQYVGPWTLVAQSSEATRPLLLSFLMLPATIMIGCSLGVLVMSGGPLRRVSHFISLILCLCFFVGTFTLTTFPATQGLTYPYYSVSYEYGIWLELVGLAILFLGLLRLREPSRRAWMFE